MFKFMKSKKGFSLVELMIVVVIMAILVAVAVPIYNAVTANARKKTCIDNQRTLINTISNEIMLKGLSVATQETVVIPTTSDGESADKANIQYGATVIDEDRFNEIFQTVPYCPAEDGKITITIGVTSAGGSTPVSSECAVTDHVL